MIQPIQQESPTRIVTIYCFTCEKDVTVKLKSWELEKNILCPLCEGKQARILSTF